MRKLNYESPRGNSCNTVDPILDLPCCGEGDPEAVKKYGDIARQHGCGESPGHDGPHRCYGFHSSLHFNNQCTHTWGHQHDTTTYRPCHCMKDESDRFCRTCRDTGRVAATTEAAAVHARLYKECYTGHHSDEWWWNLTDWVIAYGKSKVA